MYFVRLLNGSPKVMRDGRKLSDAVKTVYSDKFTPFETLPAGIEVGIDHGVEVRAVANDAEGKALVKELEKSAGAEAAAAKAYADKVRAKMAKQTAPAREANAAGMARAAELRAKHAEAKAKEAKAEAKLAKGKTKEGNGKAGAGNRTR